MGSEPKIRAVQEYILKDGKSQWSRKKRKASGTSLIQGLGPGVLGFWGSIGESGDKLSKFEAWENSRWGYLEVFFETPIRTAFLQSSS